MIKKLFGKNTLFGIVIGIILSLLIYSLYDKVIIINRQNKFVIPKDSVQIKGLINKEIIDKPITRIFQLDEEITSLNKRFDDLYILGSIIIALLLAINIGVYIRADAEIEENFNKNFAKYKEQAVNSVEESQSLIKKAQTELDLISKFRMSLEADKKKLNINNNDNSGKSET